MGYDALIQFGQMIRSFIQIARLGGERNFAAMLTRVGDSLDEHMTEEQLETTFFEEAVDADQTCFELRIQLDAEPVHLRTCVRSLSPWMVTRLTNLIWAAGCAETFLPTGVQKSVAECHCFPCVEDADLEWYAEARYAD